MKKSYARETNGMTDDKPDPFPLISVHSIQIAATRNDSIPGITPTNFPSKNPLPIKIRRISSALLFL